MVSRNRRYYTGLTDCLKIDEDLKDCYNYLTILTVFKHYLVKHQGKLGKHSSVLFVLDLQISHFHVDITSLYSFNVKLINLIISNACKCM